MIDRAYLSILLEAWQGNSSPLQKEDLFRISQRVRQISRGLTGVRQLAGSFYLEDPISLGAYLLYYWPISYRAASFILSSILPRLKKSYTALDIGAGAGPFTLALIDHGVKTVVACDRNAKTLNLLKRIAYRRNVSISTYLIDLEKGSALPKGLFPIITLGNLLNELWKDDPDRIRRRFLFVKSLLSSLEPEGRIVILEPALSSTSKELLQVRDLLTSDGTLFIEAPCFRQENCPALPEGTCHVEVPWEPPSLVREIGRRARVSDRRSVKFSYLILRPSGSLSNTSTPLSLSNGPEGLPHRVVSDPLTSKSGRVRYLVCGPCGRFPLSAEKKKIQNLSERKPGSLIPPRRGGCLSLDPYTVFFSLKRGDVVVFQGVEKRETGYGIREGSKLRILNRE
ncbi:MAG: class I SAM-dependent methyltransferase [Spirochaetes bacterium]|nr:class I SAM-dependent methyltransferase [Spirochaetota bacterium]